MYKVKDREELKGMIDSGLDVTKLDVTNVTDMSYMFYCAYSFNQSIGDWDVSNVEDMSYMFYGAYSFNQYIGNWDVSNVESMRFMFHNCPSSQDGSYIWKSGIAVFDGVICRIKHRKGNIIKAEFLNGNACYIVTNGEGIYAHGDSLKEAQYALNFKLSDRDTNNYEHLKEGDVLETGEMMLCYHVITGACLTGIREFMSRKLGDNPREKYSIKEVIGLTEGEYLGEKFSSFFRKR
jgi:hypothetical protein